MGIDALPASGQVAYAGRAFLYVLAMAAAHDRLDGLVRQAFEDHCSGWLSPLQVQAIRNLVDAHRALGADIDSLISPPMQDELGLRGCGA